MARRSSGIKLVFDVVKAIDRAGKQAERNKQKLNRAREREAERFYRESLVVEKNNRRDAEQAARDLLRSQSQAQKEELRIAKQCFDLRVSARRSLKEEFISEYLR